MFKIQKSISLENKTVTFKLVEGTTEKANRPDGSTYDKFVATKTVEEFVFDTSKVESLNTHAMLHGWSQKLGDCNVGTTDKVKKFKISVAEGKRLIDEQSWNKKSNTKEPKMKVSDIREKLKANGMTDEQIDKVLAG